MLESKMRALIKIQYVDSVAKNPKAAAVKVGNRLQKVDKRDMFKHAVDMLDLEAVLEREIGQLSGGELQRFIIAMTCVQDADIYMFDEPSSYLDVKQRLKASRMIRSILNADVYVVVVEHDLSILDYLSDYVCCLYGTPGAYGVVTMPMSVRKGINVFLEGYIPVENVKFREFSLTFRVTENDTENMLLGEAKEDKSVYSYPTLRKTLGPFSIDVVGGQFKQSEIMMLLG